MCRRDRPGERRPLLATAGCRPSGPVRAGQRTTVRSVHGGQASPPKAGPVPLRPHRAARRPCPCHRDGPGVGRGRRGARGRLRGARGVAVLGSLPTLPLRGPLHPRRHHPGCGHGGGQSAAGQQQRFPSEASPGAGGVLPNGHVGPRRTADRSHVELELPDRLAARQKWARHRLDRSSTTGGRRGTWLVGRTRRRRAPTALVRRARPKVAGQAAPTSWAARRCLTPRPAPRRPPWRAPCPRRGGSARRRRRAASARHRCW